MLENYESLCFMCFLVGQFQGHPFNVHVHYSDITNTAWVHARLCKLQKECTRSAAASDKVYLLLTHGRWFSPASSTTKTGRHDIAEILQKVRLNNNKSNQNQSINYSWITTHLTLNNNQGYMYLFFKS